VLSHPEEKVLLGIYIIEYNPEQQLFEWFCKDVEGKKFPLLSIGILMTNSLFCFPSILIKLLQISWYDNTQDHYVKE
jgi:hypothetical protein